MSTENNYKLLNKYAIFALLIWSIFIFIFLYYNIKSFYQYADELALNEAKVSVQKDFAYRSWVSSHGGVYVPITLRTPPNPYLKNIKNRDVTTNDGQSLTLMNPSYTLSQMMHDYTELYGIRTKITSSKLMNPKNKPDPWEAKALKIVEKSKLPFYEKSNINHHQYLRYLGPMITQQSCLKCHGIQGYKIGDVRGGVSISIPLKNAYENAYNQSFRSVAFGCIVWLFGLVLIWFSSNKVQQSFKMQISLYEQNIYSLVDLMEQRDSYTAGHTRRVAHYASLIARQMGCNEREIHQLYRASMLHDIGKISTPDSILLKPSRLNQSEYAVIQEHVTTGYNILKSMDIFKDLAEIVRHHHERYDGLGYPQKLKGDQIPILSYIMCLADAFDAMTTDRIYKGRKSIQEAIKEIQALRGKQFHPLVVDAAVVALRDIEIEQTIFQDPNSSLEKARFVYFYNDQLTGAYNREYLKFVLQHSEQDIYHYQGAHGIYLHHFSEYNHEFGWHAGDVLLTLFAEELRTRFPEALVFRSFGDDFIILHKKRPHTLDILPFESLKGTHVSACYHYVDLQNIQSDISIEAFEALFCHQCHESDMNA
ncbi:HD domain-containing phosphohydrolase [Sulfurospirillum sp. 1612]|uniref:HD domain-containing phosphohydrolase n=1 Tax=Sulfurospirillum sp. 1612 TaxID=3094835 RepID=UPI002F93CDF2